ncbi:MAG: nitroreductase family protein [Candidatus Altiarchaeota archaeon]|nr:nitroreductase family protein [Candidatus Altiarchaeota archaeon]
MVSDDVLKCIYNRRSIRSFLPRQLEPWKEEELLKAANSAPSAGNLQARFFYVVKNPEAKSNLSRAAYGQYFIENAPLVFVACSDSVASLKRYGRRGETLYALQDATASIQNILLAATALDLGSCWVGAFDEEEVREILSIPKHLRPIALIPVGYSNDKPLGTSRKSLGEIAKVMI